MTVKNINKDFYVTQHMVFVEFLEFVCRLAGASLIYIDYGLDSNSSEDELLQPMKNKA